MMEAAAAFLAVRPRSVGETRRRLRHLGYRDELVEQVLARLVEVGYLDDEAFARAWVESRDRARPRGEAALRRELSLKGIDRAVVDVVLEERRRPSEASSEVSEPDGHLGPSPGGSLGSSPRSPAPERAAAQRLLERRLAALLREPDARKRRQKAYALLARNGFDPETCRETVAAVLSEQDASGE